MAIVTDEQVIKVLRQYNPWWRNPAVIKEESKPQKRIAYYEALKMMQHQTLRRFVVLSGARRVGNVPDDRSFDRRRHQPMQYPVCFV